MTPRDYIEDFGSTDDNGCYQHICVDCNEEFFGHKRRVGPCKACHLKALEDVMTSINTATLSPPKEGVEEEILSWPAAYIVLANASWSYVTLITTKDLQSIIKQRND